jgi:serine/threonine protein kinase
MSTTILSKTKNKSIINNIRNQLHSVTNYIQNLDDICNSKEYNIVYEIQCFLEQELEKYNTSINIISSPNKEFLNIIVDSKEIKANNKQGVVKLVTMLMKKKKIKAILKYGKGYHKDIESILHEVTIGYFLNHLRKSGNINFMYVYTPFYCSVGKQICTIQKINKLTTCAFFEYINGKSISEYMKDNCRQNITAINSTFIKLFFQVVLALADAQAYCKFIHYDLHDENIITMKLKSPVNITYKYIGYVLNDIDFLPCIIDYGNSIVQSPKDHSVFLGPFTDEKIKLKYFEDLAYSKDPFLSCYDIFHFSMMSLYSISRCDHETKEDIEKIWKIMMSFFIFRVQQGIPVSASCKKYLTSQKFTSDSLYYRLKVQDKELVNVDIKLYLQYLIQIINPTNLEKIEIDETKD